MPDPIQLKEKPHTYVGKRQHLLYYEYVRRIVEGVGADASSMLDVGSSRTSMLEWFDWAPRRDAIDIKRVYKSENVRGIIGDFMEFRPEEPYDLVLCLQTLEHIPDATAFARRLFEVGRSVLVSVPFKWSRGSCKSHVHDPVDREKLRSWTGRDPHYDIVVEEVLSRGSKRRRLISYYHGKTEPWSIMDANESMRRRVGSLAAE